MQAAFNIVFVMRNLCLLNRTYKIIYIYITQLVAVP